MSRMKTIIICGALLLLASTTAQAQVMPAPQKSPRVPVKSELIVAKSPLPSSRFLEGKAIILDAERLKLAGYEIRLFGVVPPQMSASFGPQARAVVDAMAAGTTTCRIKDRDREGRLLATCSNEDKADFGIELLRRGLAVSARGSLEASEFAAPYLAAEQAAQEQRLGLWSNQSPTPATEKSIREAAIKTAAAKAELTTLKEDEAKAKAEIESLSRASTPVPPTADTLHAAAISMKEQERPATVALVSDKPEEVLLSGALSTGLLSNSLEPGAIQASTPEYSPPALSFVERYQLLITGLLFLISTLAVTGGVILYKLRQKEDDLRAIAAALRGELMAARSICQARLAKIANEEDESNTRWPRIRSTVFQAYVGSLGRLGAELSRQIASIYGQASDYASYYNTNDDGSEGASKRQALASLVHHIEEVTPRLSMIEKNGQIRPKNPGLLPRSLAHMIAVRQTKPLSLSKTPQTPPPSNGPGPGSARPLPPSSKSDQERRARSASMAANISKAKNEVLSEPPANPKTETPQAESYPRQMPANATATKTEKRKPEPTQHAGEEQKQRPPLSQRAIVKDPPRKHEGFVNFAAPIFDKLSKLKNRVALASDNYKPTYDLQDFTIPDYANLTEEELEALLYAEEEMFLATPVGKHRFTS